MSGSNTSKAVPYENDQSASHAMVTMKKRAPGFERYSQRYRRKMTDAMPEASAPAASHETVTTLADIYAI
jgi:hypothetical protein